MSNAAGAAAHIRLIEELAQKDTAVHRRHPVSHLLVTALYVLTVASYGKYALTGLLPLILYPVFVLSAGDIPPGVIARRLLPAAPFLAFIGLFNPIFDQRTWLLLGCPVSAGWLSLLSILLRGVLALSAALLLLALVGMGGLSAALRSLRVPRVLVMQLLLTFRYIHVLADEAQRMMLAYRLRAPRQRGIARGQWGSLAGQWLLRTLHRAERLHQAMLCRGFRGDLPQAGPARFLPADGLYLIAWAAFFLLARLVDLPMLLGSLFT